MRKWLVAVDLLIAINAIALAQDDRLVFPTIVGSTSSCTPTKLFEIAACGQIEGDFDCKTTKIKDASGNLNIGAIGESETQKDCDYFILASDRCRPSAEKASWKKSSESAEISVTNYKRKVGVPIRLFYMEGQTDQANRARAGKGVQKVAGVELRIEEASIQIDADSGGPRAFSCLAESRLPAKFKSEITTNRNASKGKKKILVLFVPALSGGEKGCYGSDFILIGKDADGHMLMHEVGHSLGLCDSEGGNDLMRPDSAARNSLSIGELAIAFLDPYSVVNRFSLQPGGFALTGNCGLTVACQSCLKRERNEKCYSRYPFVIQSSIVPSLGLAITDKIEASQCENERNVITGSVLELIRDDPPLKEKLENEILEIFQERKAPPSRGILEGLKIVGGVRSLQELKKVEPKTEQLEQVIKLMEEHAPPAALPD